MSNFVQGLAWKVECAPTVKLVLMALADWSNDDGEAYPGQKSIAKRACCSDRTVRSALATLREMGLVSWEVRNSIQRRETNLYQINMDALCRAANISAGERKPASTGERKPVSDKPQVYKPQDKQINAGAREEQVSQSTEDKLTHGEIINAMRRLGGKVRIGDTYFRKTANEIIAMGATKDNFMDACKKAALAKSGESWGIAYVRKVIASMVAGKAAAEQPKQWHESASGILAKADEMAAQGFELRAGEVPYVTKERLQEFMGTHPSSASNPGKREQGSVVHT